MDIALHYANKDSRIFIISKPNGGQSSARNVGIEFIKNSSLRKYVENLEISNMNFDFSFKNYIYPEAETRITKHILNIMDNFTSSVPSFQNANLNKIVMQYPNILMLTENDPNSNEISQELKENIIKVAHNHVILNVDRINEYIRQLLPENQFIHFLDPDDYFTLDAMESNICFLDKYPNLEFTWHHLNVVDTVQTDKNIDKDISKSVETNVFEDTILPKYKYSLIDGKTLIDIHMKRYSFFSLCTQGAIKTSVFNKNFLRFIDNAVFEDQVFGIFMMNNIEFCTVTDKRVYVYRLRPGSTCTYEMQEKDNEIYLSPHMKQIKQIKILTNRQIRQYHTCISMLVLGFSVFTNKHLLPKYVVDKYVNYFSTNFIDFIENKNMLSYINEHKILYSTLLDIECNKELNILFSKIQKKYYWLKIKYYIKSFLKKYFPLLFKFLKYLLKPNKNR